MYQWQCGKRCSSAAVCQERQQHAPVCGWVSRAGDCYVQQHWSHKDGVGMHSSWLAFTAYSRVTKVRVSLQNYSPSRHVPLIHGWLLASLLPIVFSSRGLMHPRFESYPNCWYFGYGNTLQALYSVPKRRHMTGLGISILVTLFALVTHSIVAIRLSNYRIGTPKKMF